MQLFLQLCSLCVCLKAGDICVDARVVSLDGNAASNALQKYGLNFDQLNILQEHNLIIPDYNSYFDYRICVARNAEGVSNLVAFPFRYQNKDYGLLPVAERPEDQALLLHGIALSKSGKELLKVVNIQSSENYTSALTDYFAWHNLQMLEINKRSEN